MAVKYGNTFTASDAKNVMEKTQRQKNGVRTWQQLFGNTSYAATAQSDMLKQTYGDVISQAYAANLANKNTIYGAGLTAGSMNRLLDDNNQAFQSAYQQYLANYQDANTTLQDNYQKAMNSINDEMNAEAENYAKLYNYTYDYIRDELQYSTYRGINNEFANMFITSKEIEDGKYDSSMEGQLKDWNTIAIENGLVDDDGNLTMAGKKYLDMVFNAAPQSSLYTDEDSTRFTKSFDEWLSDKDSDLRTWYSSADPYNYTKAGTRFGTAKQMAGLESADNAYHSGEYLTQDDNPEMHGSNLLPKKNNLVDFTKVDDAIDTFKKTYGADAYTAEMDKTVQTKKNEYLTAQNTWNEIKDLTSSGLVNRILTLYEEKFGKGSTDGASISNLSTYASKIGRSDLYEAYKVTNQYGKPLSQIKTSKQYKSYETAKKNYSDALIEVFDTGYKNHLSNVGKVSGY